MPSSSPMQSAQHTPTPPLHREEDRDYRQTMYHDKAGVQIAECRRRAGITRRAEPSTYTYVDFVLYPVDRIQLSSKPLSYDSSHRAVSTMKPDEFNPRPHVTSAKPSSKIRPKPAIVQRATEPNRTLPGGEKTPSYYVGEPTPPPTPRVSRLPTPELSELKEVPFCDCGIKSHVVRRCRTCSKEADLWSV